MLPRELAYAETQELRKFVMLFSYMFVSVLKIYSKDIELQFLIEQPLTRRAAHIALQIPPKKIFGPNYLWNLINQRCHVHKKAVRTFFDASWLSEATERSHAPIVKFK